MKKNLSKRIAVILSAVLLLSLGMPAAFAAEATETVITFTDDAATVSGASDGLSVKGTDVKISASGVYRCTGACAQGTIVVKKNVKGVTLILDGLTLSASATAPITCNKGTEVEIVAAAGTVSTLADDKYNNDDLYSDETYPEIENAVIKCKDGSNVVLSGSGTIIINANGKNGIKGGADLYEEDADGNPTDTLLSAASLTIRDVTLQITAAVNDGLKADKELNILSGTVTVSAAADGIKSDYTLNIGADGTAGPVINVTKSTEGIEAATLNVYSGSVSVTATDDGINAANSDLTGYAFSYNQYGGFVRVNCTNGDGIDSNGTIRLNGGTLEVYSPAQGDGDPLDADGGTTFGGATVLAVGHNAMMQKYTATTPYVTFGSAAGGPGGPGEPGGPGRNSAETEASSEVFGGGATLVKAGSVIEIRDATGNTLYSATAVRDASYIVFASPDLTSGAACTLTVNGSAAATANATTASTDGMQPGDGPEMGDGEQPGGILSAVLAYIRSVITWISSMIQTIRSFFSQLNAAA